MFYLAAIVFVMVLPLGVPTVATIIHAIGKRTKDPVADYRERMGVRREAAVSA